MKSFSKMKATSIAALFIFCNFIGQVSSASTEAGVVSVFDEPDTSRLQYINEQYLFSCEAPKVWEGYEVFDETLKSLNQKTFTVVKDLANHNKEIRKMTVDLGRQLEKVYLNVANKDVRRQKRSVLRQMDQVKDGLEDTRGEIDKNQKLVDTSQQQIGGIYCRVNQYADFYFERSEIAKENEMNDVAVYDESTSAKMRVKRRQLFTIMEEFDNYFGYLDQLFRHCEHKVALLDSVQRNIVAFIDGKCRDKSQACVYEMEADLRFQEAQLQKLLADIEVAFLRLVTTAKENFFETIKEGEGHVARQESSYDNPR